MHRMLWSGVNWTIYEQTLQLQNPRDKTILPLERSQGFPDL